MSVYRAGEERLVYQTCPGCKADIELEANECLFCDHNFRQEPIASSKPVQEPESTTCSYLSMFMTNLLISVLGVLGTQIEHQSGTDVYRHHKAISEKDKELFVKFLLKHDKSTSEEIRTLLILDQETKHVKPITVTVSNKQRDAMPYAQILSENHDIDLLKRVRIPQTKQ